MHRVYRNYRGEQALVGVRQVALGHQGPASPSTDRCSYTGVLQVQLGGIQRGLGSLYTGPGAHQRGIALIVFLTGYCPAFQQRLGPAGFTSGQIKLAVGQRQFGTRRLLLGFVRTWIYLEQQLAGLHQFAFLKGHLVDVATDAGPQVHRFRRCHTACE